jgi:hypothetical protein
LFLLGRIDIPINGPCGPRRIEFFLLKRTALFGEKPPGKLSDIPRSLSQTIQPFARSDSVWPLTIRARREQVSLPSPHFRHNGALPLHGNASAAFRVRASFFKGRPCRHYRADDSRHGLPENRQPYGNYTISSGSCHVNGNMTSHFAQNSTREPPFFGG